MDRRQINAQSPLPATAASPAASSALPQSHVSYTPAPAQSVPQSRPLMHQSHLAASWQPSSSFQPDQAFQQRPGSPQETLQARSTAMPQQRQAAVRPGSAGGQFAGSTGQTGRPGSGEVFYDAAERVSAQAAFAPPHQQVSRSAQPLRAPQQSAHAQAQQPAAGQGPGPYPAQGSGYGQLSLRSTMESSNGSLRSIQPQPLTRQANTPQNQYYAGKPLCHADGLPVYLEHPNFTGQRLQPHLQPLAMSAAPDQIMWQRNIAFASALHAATTPSNGAAHTFAHPSITRADGYPGHNGPAYSTGQTGNTGRSRLAPQPGPEPSRRWSDPTMLWHNPVQTMQDAPGLGTSPTVMW